MTWARRKFRRLSAVLAAGLLLACSPASATNNIPATAGAEGGRINPATPPPPPKSWVDSFRALLEMPAAEQQKLLAIHPPAIQERLLEKIHEYLSLTPEERALRLQATELRWYLVPLLSMPATNRAAHLARIPESTRKLVETRLQYWMLLPPPLQQVFLTNQQAVYFLAHGGGTTNTPPSPDEALRRRMQETVERFLELTQKEKEKALRTFSDVERQQMEKTIAAFERLTPAQRGRCVRSFTRFATMSPEARQGFLKNAEHWAQMSPTERQAWRELVSQAPIMPSLPYPRLPPQAPATSPPPAAANGN